MKAWLRLFSWALVAILFACSGAEFSQDASGTVSEVGAPGGSSHSGSTSIGSAMDSGTLGSQSASQDVTQNFAYDLRFPGEALASSSDIGGLIYWVKFNQTEFPAGTLEKAITFPDFSHAPCCEGRVLRVVDLGSLPPVPGNGVEQEAYRTFGQLPLGYYDWDTLDQARFRDYVVGAPDQLGQNLFWKDLPAEEGHFLSFFLLPEGTEVVAQWSAFESEQALIQIYVNKDIVQIRDLRVVANSSKISPHVPF